MTIIYIYLTIISLLLLINLILKITILINKKDNINEENKDFVYKKKEKREYIEVFDSNEFIQFLKYKVPLKAQEIYAIKFEQIDKEIEKFTGGKK